MTFEEAYRRCHVRSAIYRKSNPGVLYAKNHDMPIDERVEVVDQWADDWEEWDPQEENGETPA